MRPSRRATVCSAVEEEPASGSSCLGEVGVLRGQKRVPEPPARMTAHLMWIAGGRSEQLREGRSVPAQIEEQLAGVGPGAGENEQEVAAAHRGDDGHAIAVLQDAGA